ncbi:hypothetical protein [Haloferax sulfurifontis]|uniref:Uncharacterized protein n=1 Tax=Haloferax sulfurifontis TaxID=255616 RepID=A0A830DRH5_9EURY|nr:hypothetical protein [Haloferax sulfurifontis]GGC53009.1 hypothetical protein GCM10007209_13410 [Haloferax sulfurifontis]
MAIFAPDDSPSAGERVDPREDPADQLADSIGSSSDDDDDDDDNVVDSGDYDGGGYGSIPDPPDPSNSESGMPGGGDPVVDIISPDPNENSDGDEVTVGDDGMVSIDPDRLSGGYDSVQDVADEVRNVVGSGTPSVDETTVIGEQVRNLREQLAGMGQVDDGDGSSDGLLAMGAAGVVAVVAVGVALVAGGEES